MFYECILSLWVLKVIIIISKTLREKGFMRKFSCVTFLLFMLFLASGVSNAEGFYAGYDNNASGEQSSAVGYSNFSKGYQSNAIGSFNEAIGNRSNAIGNYNRSEGYGSSVFGISNYAFADYSISLGFENNIDPTLSYIRIENGEESSAVGIRNISKGKRSNAFGMMNRSEGEQSSAFGYSNESRSDFSSSFGLRNLADGRHSSAFGTNNIANGDYSSAFGVLNYANGKNSSAFGFENAAFGENSIAIGYHSIANIENSLAIGYQAVSKERDTVSFGHSMGDSAGGIELYPTDYEMRLTHVATGTASTDAVNYGQLRAILAGSDNLLSEVQLAAVNSGITAEKLNVYDSYITSEGIYGNNKRISNILAGIDDNDAVNYGQFKLAYTSASFDNDKSQLILQNANGESNILDIPSGSGSDEKLRKTVEQHTKDIDKLLAELGSSRDKKENKVSDGSIAIGDGNESGRNDQVAMTIGSENKVTGKNSIAIGYSINGQNNDVSGDYSVAVGFGHKVSGNNSGAFGDPNVVTGDSSYAFGNDNTVNGNNSFVIGNKSQINNSGSLAIGSKNKISGENSVAIGNNVIVGHKNAVAIGEGSMTTADNTVSVGSESNKRRITNVAQAEDENDAVNYGQLKSYVAENAGGANSGEVFKLRGEVAKLDSRVSKVGASAAALAALRPMEFDPGNKWSGGIGFGNLNGKSAAAVGVFYRPNRDVFYSLGGNVGGEENIINAGVNFSFGHRSKKTEEMLAAKVTDNIEYENFCKQNADLIEKVAAQDSKLLIQNNEINELKIKNLELEAKLERLEKNMLQAKVELLERQLQDEKMKNRNKLQE